MLEVVEWWLQTLTKRLLVPLVCENNLLLLRFATPSQAQSLRTLCTAQSTNSSYRVTFWPLPLRRVRMSGNREAAREYLPAVRTRWISIREWSRCAWATAEIHSGSSLRALLIRSKKVRHQNDPWPHVCDRFRHLLRSRNCDDVWGCEIYAVRMLEIVTGGETPPPLATGRVRPTSARVLWGSGTTFLFIGRCV